MSAIVYRLLKSRWFLSKCKEGGRTSHPPPIRKLESSSVHVPQRDENISRKVRCGHTCNGAKISVGERVAGEAILWMIERVEKIRSHGELMALPGHGKSLQDADIDVLSAIQIKRIASEYRRVEIRNRQSAKRGPR